MDSPFMSLFMLYGSIPLGLLSIWHGFRLKARVGKKRWLSFAALNIAGIAVMTLNPFVNMLVFQPFAPQGYEEKMGNNEKFVGKSVDSLVLEKGQPNRIISSDGEQRWYYNVNKPFFVIEFDELEFIVREKNVQAVRIDYF